MRQTEMTTIPVQLVDRSDGGLRITSNEVPGLLLSGRGRQHVWDIVGPSLKGFLEANHGYAVTQVFYPSTTPGEPAPPESDFHVEQFAIADRRAA